MGERLRALVAAAAAAGLLAGCGAAADPAEFTGKTLDNPFAVDATALEASDGSPFSLTEDTDKRLTLVFFGYTHCPDICGQVMATLAGTVARLDDADREQLDVVFVTTDPARDTGEVVRAYVENFDDTFTGVTGDLADIVTVATSMGVAVEKGERLPSGGYDVTHGTYVMALDSADEVPVLWSENVSQAQLAADVHTLLSED